MGRWETGRWGDWETEQINISYQLSTINYQLNIYFPAIDWDAIDVESIEGSSDDKID